MKRRQPDLAAELQQSFERWEHIRQYGCNDPGWPDGVKYAKCFVMRRTAAGPLNFRI